MVKWLYNILLQYSKIEKGSNVMRSFTTDDGFTVRIFSTMYLDWGLEILDPSGESVYYNPHCIASDCVGFHDTSDEDEILNELLSISREIVKDNEYLAERILSVMHDLEAIRHDICKQIVEYHLKPGHGNRFRSS